MATKVKIKIVDDRVLRKEIDVLYEGMNDVSLAKWAISIARRSVDLASWDQESMKIINAGIRSNELWQEGQAAVKDVREASFTVHRAARACEDDLKKTILRVVGHALATGHMKGHAMVASDYAIKAIGLISFNEIETITKERKWQLESLRKLIE